MSRAASKGITGGKGGPNDPPRAGNGPEEEESGAAIPTIPSFARNNRFMTERRARRAPGAFQDRARVTYAWVSGCSPKVGRVGIAGEPSRPVDDMKCRRRT